MFVAGGVFGSHHVGGGAAGAGPGVGEGLSFMVVGDWGREGAHGQKMVAKGMTKVARKLGVRFVVSSGDNFYDAGVEKVDDRQWKASFENVYSDSSLRDIAWWSTLGNHDHLGSIGAQVKYSGHSRRWTMPSPYYAFTAMGGGGPKSVGDVQFVFLDSTPYTHDAYGKAARKIGKQNPAAQTAWLEKTLDESVAPYIVIVVHHCLYTMSTTGHLGTPELRAHIEPLLLRHRARVLAVITGHEHALMHMQPYGGLGAWAGAAAAVPPENSTDARARNHRYATASVQLADWADGVAAAAAAGASRRGRVFEYDAGKVWEDGEVSFERHRGGVRQGVGAEHAVGERRAREEATEDVDSGSGDAGPGAEERRRPPGTADHFISGGGSELDMITLPGPDKAGVWEACCGVLTLGVPETKPRGLWAVSQRGFFVFTITHDTFWAIAYDKRGRQTYVYSKPI